MSHIDRAELVAQAPKTTNDNTFHETLLDPSGHLCAFRTQFPSSPRIKRIHAARRIRNPFDKERNDVT